MKTDTKDILERLKKTNTPIKVGFDVYDHFTPRTAQELGIKVSKTLLAKEESHED